MDEGVCVDEARPTLCLPELGGLGVPGRPLAATSARLPRVKGTCARVEAEAGEGAAVPTQKGGGQGTAAATEPATPEPSRLGRRTARIKREK